MQILPFITIVLFTLALLMTSLFRGHKDSYAIQKSIVGNIEAHQTVFNLVQKKLYQDHIPKSHNPSKPRPPSCKKVFVPSNYKGFREKSLSDNSKLNLYPLILRDNAHLQKTFKTLLYLLYHDAPFFKEASHKDPQILDKLVKNILKSLKSLPKESLFLDHVVLDNPLQREFWYQMLKGGPLYDNETTWPSIKDYIYIDTQSKSPKAIYVRKASPFLLQAFFGEEMTKEVLEREKKNVLEHKRAPLKKGDWLPLLKKYDLLDLEPYIHFARGALVKVTEKTQHEASGIIVEMPYFKRSQEPIESVAPEIPDPLKVKTDVKSSSLPHN